MAWMEGLRGPRESLHRYNCQEAGFLQEAGRVSLGAGAQETGPVAYRGGLR